MKIRTFIAMAAILMFTACETPYRATDTSIVLPPQSTQAAFTSQYPNAANVVWIHYDPGDAVPIDWELAGWGTMDPSGFLVRFDEDNDNYYAWYDENGDWVGTAYVVRDFGTMPTAVSDVITNQYATYTISDVTREFQQDKMYYEVKLKDKDNDMKIVLLLDGNGNIIKKKTKTL